MRKFPLHSKKLYGTATVGAKGQVVIPAEARRELGIEEGDRLYVVGSPDSGVIGFLKEESLQEIVQHMTDQLETFRQLSTKDTHESPPSASQ